MAGLEIRGARAAPLSGMPPWMLDRANDSHAFCTYVQHVLAQTLGRAAASSATCPRTSHPRGVSLAPMTITNLRRRAGPYQRKYSLVCDKITLLQRRVRKIFDGLEAFHKMRVTVIPTYVFADPAGGQSPTRMCVRAIAWSAMNHERMVNDYIPRLDVPSEEIVKLGPVANILQIHARRGR